MEVHQGNLTPRPGPVRDLGTMAESTGLRGDIIALQVLSYAVLLARRYVGGETSGNGRVHRAVLWK